MARNVVTITIDAVKKESKVTDFVTDYESPIDEIILFNANNEQKSLLVENAEIEVIVEWVI